jgi:hypothetical protein
MMRNKAHSLAGDDVAISISTVASLALRRERTRHRVCQRRLCPARARVPPTQSAPRPCDCAYRRDAADCEAWYRATAGHRLRRLSIDSFDAAAFKIQKMLPALLRGSRGPRAAAAAALVLY